MEGEATEDTVDADSNIEQIVESFNLPRNGGEEKVKKAVDTVIFKQQNMKNSQLLAEAYQYFVAAKVDDDNEDNLDNFTDNLQQSLAILLLIELIGDNKDEIFLSIDKLDPGFTDASAASTALETLGKSIIDEGTDDSIKDAIVAIDDVAMMKTFMGDDKYKNSFGQFAELEKSL